MFLKYQRQIVLFIIAFHSILGVAGCVNQSPEITPANQNIPTPTQIVAAPPPTATPNPTDTLTQAPLPTDTLITPSTILNPENMSAGDPYMPAIGNQGYDTQHYDLKLKLDPQTTWLEGDVTIDVASTSNELEQISLDFVGFDVQQVKVNDDITGFFRQDKKLLVNLPNSAHQGEQLKLNLTYEGKPTTEASAYVPFVPHLGLQAQPNMLFVVSEPDGARYWFPVNDHPRDKATYRFEITVPEGFVGVANGSLVETIPQNSGVTYIWEHNYPMASALATVAVGNYVRIESVSANGVPLRHYVLPENQATFAEKQSTIGEMIDWMSNLYGPYPFEAFGYVEISGMGASLETQTMVVISKEGLQDESILAHEMSHMWFGDWVSLDSWGDIWRNEGFATYITQMWLRRNDPQGLDQMMAAMDQKIKENPSGYPLDTPPKNEMFGEDSYIKGAVVVHNLRKQIGDKAFFQGLHNYFEQYGGRDATQTEFQAVMEQAAGSSLESFFQGWLN